MSMSFSCKDTKDDSSSFPFNAKSASTFTQKGSFTNFITSLEMLKPSNLVAKLFFNGSIKPDMTLVICRPDFLNVGKGLSFPHIWHFPNWNLLDRIDNAFSGFLICYHLLSGCQHTLPDCLCVWDSFLPNIHDTHNNATVALSWSVHPRNKMWCLCSFQDVSPIIFCLRAAELGGKVASKFACVVLKCPLKLYSLYTARHSLQIKHTGFASTGISACFSVHSLLNCLFSESTFFL